MKIISSAGFTKYPIFSLIISIVIASIYCTKEIQKDTNVNKPNTKSNLEVSKEYLEEGFISKNTFRIVIVEPHGESDEKNAIEKKARHRAFMHLQNYLMSRKGIINQNTKARLLNLVNQNGKLSMFEKKQETRRVYFFEINKSNLKGFVDSISSRR